MTCYCQWNYVTIPAKGDVPERVAWNRATWCTACMEKTKALLGVPKRKRKAK